MYCQPAGRSWGNCVATCGASGIARAGFLAKSQFTPRSCFKMKTAHETPLEGGRHAKPRATVARAPKIPAVPLRKSLSPEEQLESTLTAELRDGLRHGFEERASHDRRVLVDKAIAGYRIVLIREDPDPLSGINLSPREREI